MEITKTKNTMDICPPKKPSFTIETDDDFPKLHTLTLVSGKRGGGKSVATANFMRLCKDRQYFQRCWLITPTYASNKEIWNIADIQEEDVLELLACYYGMMRCVDDGLGQLLDTLSRLGLDEDTIVVFTSDHGDFMGEHKQQCKGGVFYDCLTRVPLIVSWPGQPNRPAQGWRERSLVSTIDVV